MLWHVKDKELIFENGEKIKFDYSINEAIEKEDIIILILEVPVDISMTENAFGISIDKRSTLWQVEKIPATATDPVNVYTGITLRDNPGTVSLFNWNCTVVVIDIKTGKVISSEFTK